MPTVVSAFLVAVVAVLVGGELLRRPAIAGDRSGVLRVRGDVYRTMDALERVAQFLDMHKESVTLDHALGVAIARGQVEGARLILAEHPEEVPDDGGYECAVLAKRLDDLLADLGDVLRDVVADVPATRRLLQAWLWRVDPDPGRRSEPRRAASPDGGHGADAVPPTPTKAPAQTVLELRELVRLGSPSEGESGRCIAALLLEAPVVDNEETAAASCNIPEDCIRAETEGATAGYTTTHRLLFHHIASQVGCILPDRQVGTQHAMERLCRDILDEAEDVARARFPPLLRDLFAEQVAVCGLRGFSAFARPAWLGRLLDWQRPSGCFGNKTELQEAARPFEALSDNARLDDQLGNECLSHLTGVATAAAAFNLRVLVQRWLQAVRGQ